MFAQRSRNTLISIKSPEDFSHQEAEKVFSLLELSRRTIRAIDLRLDSFDSDLLPTIWVGTEGSNEYSDSSYENDIYDSYDDVVHYFQSFPKLERLHLTRSQLPEVEVDVPGGLVVLGTGRRRECGWSEDSIKWLSKLKASRLHFDEYEEDGSGIQS